MTKEPRTTQKEAAWQIMEEAYMAASGGRRELPAKARQIFYQARPKIMALTEYKELAYGYFSQTLLPDYIVACSTASPSSWAAMPGAKTAPS